MKLEKWTGSFLGKNIKNEQKKQQNKKTISTKE